MDLIGVNWDSAAHREACDLVDLDQAKVGPTNVILDCNFCHLNTDGSMGLFLHMYVARNIK